MQYRIDGDAVQNFNNNSPTIGKESFDIRSKTVTVEIYFDYYGTQNARVLIDGVCEDMCWNGGGGHSDHEWYLLKGFPYPKGLAQYKLRKRIGDTASSLWRSNNNESTYNRGVKIFSGSPWSASFPMQPLPCMNKGG
jgi:hypothetical protein